MDTREIAATLPYGEDFLFIDLVRESGRLDSIVTEKTYLLTDPLIAAHFRSGPKVVPGVILIEQICQSALLLALTSGRLPRGGQFILGNVRATFIAPAVAECTVTAKVTIDDPAGGFAFQGLVEIEGRLLARVQGIAMAAKQSQVE